MPKRNLAGEEIDQPATSDSQVSTLSFSDNKKLDDEGAAKLCAELPAKKRLKTLKIDGFFDIQTAQSLFFSFMASNSLRKLSMPMWSVVNTPSQKHLTRLQEDFEDSIAAHNTRRQHEKMRLNLFKRLNDKGLKALSGQDLPDLCMQRIQEYVVPVKKTIRL